MQLLVKSDMLVLVNCLHFGLQQLPYTITVTHCNVQAVEKQQPHDSSHKRRLQCTAQS